MKKIISLTFVAALAIAFIGCDTMKETNTNKALVVNNNANAAVMNSNVMNSNAMMNSNTMMNSNMSNKALTREEYDREKDKYAAEAKGAGRTIGSGVNDGWLWTKTKTGLATVNDLRDSTINVDVSNAVVTLSGTVGTKEQQMMAVKTAQEIDGVTSVKNNLKVSAGDSLTNQMTGANSNMKMTNANKKP